MHIWERKGKRENEGERERERESERAQIQADVTNIALIKLECH